MYFFLFEIEWKELLLGTEKWSFLLETGFRTVIMFLIILLSLRMLGKRGIKQLSVFELGVIVGLGSAAGDPMFYKDVGLLPGLLVFAVVLGMYRLITFFINRNDKFEKFVEGEAAIIIQNGCLLLKNFQKEPIARDELYAQLRLNCVSHLGQIKLAILETNGEVSIFYFTDKEVRFGLPVIPTLCNDKQQMISSTGIYACSHCGYIKQTEPAPAIICPVCENKEWVKAIDEKRIC